MSFLEQIDNKKVPNHVAIIMDGNGRWAKKRGLLRVFGHEKGANAVREAIEAAGDTGITHLTLYAFSTENWNRPRVEVNKLMNLLVSSLKKRISTTS
jgi:undecaprenyl diphosphate synthase